MWPLCTRSWLGHELRSKITEHIAKLWWNGELHRLCYYDKPRTEVPEIGKDVDKRWDELQAIWGEKQRVEGLSNPAPNAFAAACLKAKREEEAFYAKSRGPRRTCQQNGKK